MSMARMRAGPNRAAHCTAMTPTGPRPTTTTVDPGDGGPERADVARRQDVGEQHRRLVGHAFGDRQGELVGERNGHRLGLPAREVGHGAERGGLAGQAHVGLPGQAGPAQAAADDARHEDAVARRDVCTSAPTSATVPMASWPSRMPAPVGASW